MLYIWRLYFTTWGAVELQQQGHIMKACKGRHPCMQSHYDMPQLAT